MKNKTATTRAVPEMERAELEGLVTKQLLARLRRLQACEESRALSDMTVEEVRAVQGILFKDTPEWKRAHKSVKEVLATREHVPGGAERKQIRQARAKRSRNAERTRRR